MHRYTLPVDDKTGGFTVNIFGQFENWLMKRDEASDSKAETQQKGWNNRHRFFSSIEPIPSCELHD
jgi:hypothetical protein